MKRLVLVAVLLAYMAHSFAQGMYGFEGGIGKALSYKSNYTPAFSGYHLWRLGRTVYFGGALSFQRYSFLDNLNPAPPSYGDVISVNQKCSYLFFSPTLDFGLGFHKYVHLHFSYGVGVYTGGHQTTNKYEPYWTPPGGTPYGSDTTAFNTTYNIPTFMMRYGAGLSERIPTGGYFSVVLSQEFSVIPGKLSAKGPGLNTNYVAFTIGVTHKYPMVTTEDEGY
jgi:hypothetical protein